MRRTVHTVFEPTTQWIFLEGNIGEPYSNTNIQVEEEIEELRTALEAMKEQQKQIDELKNKINQLI